MGFAGESLDGPSVLQLPQADITKWMLQGMNMRPGGRPGDDAPITLFMDLFEHEEPEEQQKLASALTNAITQWNSRTYTTDTLRTLISAANMTQTEAAIPAIIAIVDERRIPPSDAHQTEAVAVSVTSSFTPNKIAHEALKRWWNDPSMSWRYTWLMFDGLIHSEPQNIKNILPKLLHVMEKHTDDFYPGLIAEDTAEVVGVNELETVLKEFSGPAAQRLLAEIPAIRNLN